MLHTGRGEWRDAADAFEQATRLVPFDAPSWIGYAMSLIATQDLRGARDARKMLLERFTDRGEAHLIDGHIHKIQGEFAEAIDSYRRAVSVEPEQTDALFNLVDLSTPGTSDSLTKRLETLLRRASLTNRQSANIRFSLARIYEKAGYVDEAFAFYREANAASDAMMRGTGNSYDPARFEEDTEQVIKLFSRDLLMRSLEPVDLDMRLIFVVGLPRSGTTLVERILSSHSQVCAGGELPFMQDCLARVKSNRNAIGVRSGLRLDDDDDKRLLLQLRTEYLDALFERELDGAYVTDKLPANFSALGLVRVLFPDALIVHCVRDPIATCWSLYSAHFGAHLSYYTSLENLSHYYRNVYAKLMRHWETIEGMDIITVNYEELVTNPEPSIRELIARCGLPWEDVYLNFQDNNQPLYTASLRQARQPIYATSIARWRQFERHLGPLAERLR
jgi:tetratricopeptide (TPR) repeat protein